MELPKLTLAEVVDKYTILRLKHEHGLSVQEEMEALAEVVRFYKLSWQPLYDINREMWLIEEKITWTKDLARVGLLYVELRRLTLERHKAKNEIAQANREPLEQKRY